MYFQEEPEHILIIRQQIKRFIAEEMPRDLVRQWDRDMHMPKDVMCKLAKLGVCGLTVDEQYGGIGRDIYAALVVIEELARRSMHLAGPFIHTAFYGGINISESGSEAQKQAYLPKLARGELMFAYGLSEPDVGGDLADVRTTARRTSDGAHVIINGTKRWCTAARESDFIYCLVRSDTEAPRYHNLSFVLVPTDAPGISFSDIEHTGLRYAKTGDVILDDVQIPVENIVGGEAGWNTGWSKLIGPALDVERLEITTCALGIAHAAVEDAWQYAQERRQFGKLISSHQAIRHTLADAKTKLQACDHMLYHAAWLANEGKPCAVESSMAKLFIGETALEIALECQKVMGAYGLATEYDMERYVRDLMCMPIVGGSSNMQRNNITGQLHLARD
ncbi:MAG: acyl-CoA dehydrogenase [Gammaproteobacteria bacterium]|nr:MAG: acyl-CoA dehydrogenase [Gammaproteobacteria bacterium]